MSDFTSVSWDTSAGQQPQQQPSSERETGKKSVYERVNSEHEEGEFDEEGVVNEGQQRKTIVPSSSDDDEESSSSAAIAESSSSAAAGSSSSVYFHCTVSDPQKEQDGSQNAYISYLVTTDTNSPSFQLPHVKVRRRFSDFVYLYTSLVNQFTASAVPPLPDKSRLEYLKGDRFGGEFTLKRASSLTRFLSRITNHPLLRKSRIFYTFLESDEWNAYKQHKGASRLSGGGSVGVGVDSVAGGVAAGAAAAAAAIGVGGNSAEGSSVLDGIPDNFLNAFAKVKVQSKELVEVKDRSDKLDDNLTSIVKTYSRVVRRQADLVHDLEEFAQQIMKLAALEPKLSLEFSEFAKGIQDFARGTYVLREQVDNDYIVSLKDMENYVASLKALIRLRDQKQLDYEGLVGYLNTDESNRLVLEKGGGSNFFLNKVEDLRGVNHEVARKERLHKLEAKIKSLKKEVDSAKIESETFEEATLKEVAIFDNTKYLEMKETLTNLSEGHIQFFQGMIKELTSIADNINHNRVSNNRKSSMSSS